MDAITEERNRVLQLDFRDRLPTSILESTWIDAHVLGEMLPRDSFAQICGLLPIESASHALERPEWDLSIGSPYAGFDYSDASGEPVPEYRYLPKGEPQRVVLYRSFHGVREPIIEISEEFRLFHGLAPSEDGISLNAFGESGEEIEVVRFAPHGVQIRAKHIRRFAAAKRMVPFVYFDSFVFSDHSLEELGLNVHETEGFKSNNLNYNFSLQDDRVGISSWQSNSRILGKCCFPIWDETKSEVWPFEKPRRFEAFIVGESSDSEFVEFSCEPGQLANNFGANSENPHFLTPVFFDRAVLQKYFADTGRFSVEDGLLRCQGLWGLRLDIHHPDHVMVFLGDLGETLPYEEQRYWRSFNLPPEDREISETTIRRSFLGQFAPAKRGTTHFLNRYDEVNKAWKQTFGWPVFEELTPDDEHRRASLRDPLNDDPGEFESQVSTLEKMLIESLNKKMLDGDERKSEGSIMALENWLKSRSLDGGEDLVFLRRLRDLGNGIRHTKGEKYERAEEFFDMKSQTPRRTFAKILEKSSSLFLALERAIESGSE